MGLVYFFPDEVILIENTVICKWHSSKGHGIPIALNAAPGFQLFQIKFTW